MGQLRCVTCCVYAFAVFINRAAFERYGLVTNPTCRNEARRHFATSCAEGSITRDRPGPGAAERCDLGGIYNLRDRETLICSRSLTSAGQCFRSVATLEHQVTSHMKSIPHVVRLEKTG